VKYRFEAGDESQIPLAARRALASSGRRLSKADWQSLPATTQGELARLGAERTVPVPRVVSLLAGVAVDPEILGPLPDLPSQEVPREVLVAYGSERPISRSAWSSLSPLDRFALAEAEAAVAADAYDEIVGRSAVSAHLGPAGGARMIDVAEKAPTLRQAVSESRITMNEAAFALLASGGAAKGDVLGVARLAGIMASKRTSELIPLCHPLALSKVVVELELDEGARAVLVLATAEAVDRTGVEMESLVAASVAALTVYDMLKSVDRAMVIGPTRLIRKTGGKSGDFSA
jgi:cyclic pyranopterin monophosphate synthase